MSPTVPSIKRLSRLARISMACSAISMPNRPYKNSRIVCQRLVPTVDGSLTAGVEICINTGRVAERIADPDKTSEIHEVMADGAYYGMITFDQALLQLVKLGRVSIEEATTAASSPHDFQLMLQQAGMPLSVGVSV